MSNSKTRTETSEEKLEKMRLVNERLKAKEAQKARRLLELATGMGSFDALKIIREQIEADISKVNGHCRDK